MVPVARSGMREGQGRAQGRKRVACAAPRGVCTLPWLGGVRPRPLNHSIDCFLALLRWSARRWPAVPYPPLVAQRAHDSELYSAVSEHKALRVAPAATVLERLRPLTILLPPLIRTPYSCDPVPDAVQRPPKAACLLSRCDDPCAPGMRPLRPSSSHRQASWGGLHMRMRIPRTHRATYP